MRRYYSTCLPILFAIFLQFFQIQATEKKEFVIIGNPFYNPGMFSVLHSVAGFLSHYEKGYFTGVKVDFEKEGLYYDPDHGPNWWEYYFEPLEVGHAHFNNVKRCTGVECGRYAAYTEFDLSKYEVYELIQKYIKVKPYIQSRLDRFIYNNFANHFIIGVHYRGTDKYKEAPRVPYEEVLNVVKEQIEELHLKNFRIFVATDEQEFLKYMSAHFPFRIIYQEAYRSTSTKKPIHLDNSNPYKAGKEALIDALLLSRTDLLIRTSSNLSLWSTYFNPHVPVIMLNERHKT